MENSLIAGGSHCCGLCGRVCTIAEYADGCKVCKVQRGVISIPVPVYYGQSGNVSDGNAPRNPSPVNFACNEAVRREFCYRDNVSWFLPDKRP